MLRHSQKALQVAELDVVVDHVLVVIVAIVYS